MATASTSEKTKADSDIRDDESSAKRVRVEEDKQDAKAPVFGLGAKGFGSISTSSSWLKPADGASKPISFGGVGSSVTGFKSFGDVSSSSGKPSPFSFSTKSSAPFSFSSKPTGGTSFSFGGIKSTASTPSVSVNDTAKSVEDESTEKEDKVSERAESDAESESGDHKFGSNIEELTPEPVLKTAISHGVQMPQDDGDQITGEEEENVLMSLRAKLYQLVPKAVKKSNVSDDKGADKVEETVKSSDKEVEVEKEVSADEAEKKEKRGEITAAAPLKQKQQISQNEWRECGVGNIRLLEPKSNKGLGQGRLVMRREKTESLILNVNLATVKPSRVGDKAASFSCLAPDAEQQLTASTYLLKTKMKEDMQKFFDLLLSTKEKNSV